MQNTQPHASAWGTKVSGDPKLNESVVSAYRPNSIYATTPQNTTDDILVEFNAEGEANLLSDSGTAPAGIPPLHLDDGIHQFFGWTLRSGPATTLRREKQPVLAFTQGSVEIQNC